jgi:transposase InsO family protein
MKYEAIHTHGSEFKVRRMCRVLELKPYGDYQWLRRWEKREAYRKEERELSLLIRKVFEDNGQTYGYRKMQLAMEKEGHVLSAYKLRKLMRQNGLYPIAARKFKPFRNGKVDGRFYDNKLKQNFFTEQEDRVWAGDITYIKTNQGFMYLAAVMDLYNREIIGYSISKNIDSELTKNALGNALARTNRRNGKVIFHSDRGSQYASIAFQQMLKKHSMEGSMSRPGCPYDNACLESFFSTAKKERIYRKEYGTLEEVKSDLFEYIELFYNRKRMHSHLGYMSPVEYRIAKEKEKQAKTNNSMMHMTAQM